MQPDTDISDENLKSRVDAACIQFLRDNCRSAILVNSILGILSAAVIWLKTDSGHIAFWLAACLSANLARYAIVLKYPSASDRLEDYRAWTRTFALSTALSGLAWGYAALFYTDPHLPELDVFLIICILGIATGAVSSLYANFPTYAAFCLPTLIPLVAALALRGGVTNTALGFMGLLFIFMLLATAFKSHKILRNSLKERFRNEALAHATGLTAEAFAERHATFLEAGMDGVLTKPFTERQPMETLSRAAGQNLMQNGPSKGAPAWPDEQKTGDAGHGGPSGTVRIIPELIGDKDKLDAFRRQVNLEKVNALLVLAQENLTSSAADLHRAMDEGDTEQIRGIAHKITGATGSLFAPRVSELAAIIEDQSSNHETVSSLMPEFDKAVAETLDWWKAESS